MTNGLVHVTRRSSARDKALVTMTERLVTATGRIVTMTEGFVHATRRSSARDKALVTVTEGFVHVTRRMPVGRSNERARPRDLTAPPSFAGGPEALHDGG